MSREILISRSSSVQIIRFRLCTAVSIDMHMYALKIINDKISQRTRPWVMVSWVCIKINNNNHTAVLSFLMLLPTEKVMVEITLILHGY